MPNPNKYIVSKVNLTQSEENKSRSSGDSYFIYRVWINYNEDAIIHIIQDIDKHRTHGDLKIIPKDFELTFDTNIGILIRI